jgi:nucleoid-associated protein YgaU
MKKYVIYFILIFMFMWTPMLFAWTPDRSPAVLKESSTAYLVGGETVRAEADTSSKSIAYKAAVTRETEASDTDVDAETDTLYIEETDTKIEEPATVVATTAMDTGKEGNDSKVNIIREAISAKKTESKTEAKSETKTEAKAEIKGEVKAESKTETGSDATAGKAVTGITVSAKAETEDKDKNTGDGSADNNIAPDEKASADKKTSEEASEEKNPDKMTADKKATDKNADEKEVTEAEVSAEETAESKSAGEKTAEKQRTIPGDSYTVVKGDCLWNIAKARYGSGIDYVRIYEANKSVIGDNPDLIYPGTQLVLP